jgi:two-component system, NtrC family, sensor histidine kinase PilS
MGRLSASIAHEIRNPLGAIRHANSLLSEQVLADLALHTEAQGQVLPGAPIDSGGAALVVSRPSVPMARAKQQARLAKIIEDNTVRINTIVEDVLAIARRDRAQIEAIRLADYLPPMLEELFAHKQIQAERVVLLLKAEDPCYFDAGHLRQVLVNLLDNALRFAPPTSAAVKLEWAQNVEGRLQLTVADAGPGIDAAQIEHVFEPFYTTHTQGTGLGLFLVREWCLANQAEISYQRQFDSSIYSGAFIIEPEQNK